MAANSREGVIQNVAERESPDDHLIDGADEIGIRNKAGGNSDAARVGFQFRHVFRERQRRIKTERELPRRHFAGELGHRVFE
jgi:hypothetical protein